jgi:glycosyltransferase involved in cell wall biosynthesis
MRIALFENLTSGGSKREAHEFARQFVRAGHAVDVFTPTTADRDFLPFAGTGARWFEHPVNLLPDRPPRFPGLTRYFSVTTTLLNLRRLKSLARTMAAAIDDGGYDFVFAHHDRIAQGPYLLRYLRTPSVYFCAEPMRRFYDPPVTRPFDQPRSLVASAQRRWYAPARAIEAGVVRRVDRKNVLRAGLLVTNSCFSAESIYRAYGARARVVYLGVDVERFCPEELPREPFVLSVGAVGPLKGYDFLIRGLAEVPAQARPQLVIVGNTASRSERCYLDLLARDLGVQLSVLVNVADGDLADLYRRAKVLVYAPVLEPFGLAPLEAMACATPVVGVREGGVRESVVDGVTGLLVDRAPRAFAEAVYSLLGDDNKRRRMGEAGRARVLDFWTWEHAYERLRAVVAEFLGPRGKEPAGHTGRPCSPLVGPARDLRGPSGGRPATENLGGDGKRRLQDSEPGRVPAPALNPSEDSE